MKRRFSLTAPAFAGKVLAKMEYFYADDGTLIGKAFNGRRVEMTSFGETDNKNAFFTGKPMIDELGYSFLFRDYNPNQGKWTTAVPLGYPDGWNNLAYVNNGVTIVFDWFGAEVRLCQKKFILLKSYKEI